MSDADTSAPPTHIRWMIRRDLDQVTAIEQHSSPTPWKEKDFLRNLQSRNCIGMVCEDEIEPPLADRPIYGHMIYELHPRYLKLTNIGAADEFKDVVIHRLCDRLKYKLESHQREWIAAEIPRDNDALRLALQTEGLKVTGLKRVRGTTLLTLEFSYEPQRAANISTRHEKFRAKHPEFWLVNPTETPEDRKERIAKELAEEAKLRRDEHAAVSDDAAVATPEAASAFDDSRTLRSVERWERKHSDWYDIAYDWDRNASHSGYRQMLFEAFKQVRQSFIDYDKEEDYLGAVKQSFARKVVDAAGYAPRSSKRKALETEVIAAFDAKDEALADHFQIVGEVKVNSVKASKKHRPERIAS